jgi:chaperonin cofactor prefoldin
MKKPRACQAKNPDTCVHHGSPLNISSTTITAAERKNRTDISIYSDPHLAGGDLWTPEKLNDAKLNDEAYVVRSREKFDPTGENMKASIERLKELHTDAHTYYEENFGGLAWTKEDYDSTKEIFAGNTRDRLKSNLNTALEQQDIQKKYLAAKRQAEKVLKKVGNEPTDPLFKALQTAKLKKTLDKQIWLYETTVKTLESKEKMAEEKSEKKNLHIQAIVGRAVILDLKDYKRKLSSPTVYED